MKRGAPPRNDTMFGISGSEAVFWLVLAVIVIGPTNLPRAARALRDFLSAFRRTLEQMRSGVDREISASLRASGLQDLGLRGGLDDYLTGADEEFVPVPPPAAPEPEVTADINATDRPLPAETGPAGSERHSGVQPSN